MLRYLNISCLLVICTAGTLRAAANPHAIPPSTLNEVWTNEDLERLSRVPSLISIVGQPDNETLKAVEIHAPAKKPRKAKWYAAQAASLNAQLEAEQADLRAFTQSLDDARELKNQTGGINLSQQDLGITPEATAHILQKRVRETEVRLDALEDLARRNGIEPGILRRQS